MGLCANCERDRPLISDRQGGTNITCLTYVKTLHIAHGCCNLTQKYVKYQSWLLFVYVYNYHCPAFNKDPQIIYFGYYKYNVESGLEEETCQHSCISPSPSLGPPCPFLLFQPPCSSVRHSHRPPAHIPQNYCPPCVLPQGDSQQTQWPSSNSQLSTFPPIWQLWDTTNLSRLPQMATDHLPGIALWYDACFFTERKGESDRPRDEKLTHCTTDFLEEMCFTRCSLTQREVDKNICRSLVSSF